MADHKRRAREESGSGEMEEELTIFTLGYGVGKNRWQYDDIISVLRAVDVENIVDVRRQTTSRNRRYWHKPEEGQTYLRDWLARNGIQYASVRDLGPPKWLLRATRRGEVEEDEYIEAYLAHLHGDDAARRAFYKLCTVISAGIRVCLLCAEVDPTYCHRTHLAAALAEELASEHRGVHVTALVPPGFWTE